MATSKRPPRRETAPPPWEWGGEHYTSEEAGRLVLWSVVRDIKAEYVVHRASLRRRPKGFAEISFDSNSLKPARRRWQVLAPRMLLALPVAHRQAVVKWVG